jgi:hypothetical protein
VFLEGCGKAKGHVRSVTLRILHFGKGVAFDYHTFFLGMKRELIRLRERIYAFEYV